ncbi:exonuclease V a 5' deoxyribonuclease-domain-containing protein [Mucidula mucida]|nr:exonuclease V a 5' deoxyribonuclease-domain-containing protein [Mucidula mucida]
MSTILRPLGLLHKSLSLATYSTVAKMPQSGNDTDEYSEGEFAGLTEEDFDKLDAISYPKKPLVRAASCTTDEFSDGGFGTLTEQDFEILDAAAVVSLSSSSSKADLAAPGVQITYDSDDLPDMKIPERSPFQRFRKSKRLSVTDLVSPAWCEVQFEYGLYGKRTKKLEHRPKSFVSRLGKTIVAEKEVAVVNDKILKAEALHKKLEKQLKPVAVQSPLVNMLSAMQSVIAEGQAREVPVFGIIRGDIVTGIIDEIVRDKLPEKTKRSRDASRDNITEDNQSRITDYATKIPDSPIRCSPASDTMQSRLQLMTYHHLLSSLLDMKHPYDFVEFWRAVDVDSNWTFSDKFIEDARSVLGDVQFTCLDDLTRLWTERIPELDISGLEKSLQLVYRRRKPKPGDALPPDADDIVVAQQLSLLEHWNKMLSDRNYQASADALPLPTNLLGVAVNTSTPMPSRKEDPFRIIGTKEFDHDPTFLDNYLVSILEWWHGRRPAEGVSIENARRCNYCEYKNDCEWREEKALGTRQPLVLLPPSLRYRCPVCIYL